MKRIALVAACALLAACGSAKQPAGETDAVAANAVVPAEPDIAAIENAAENVAASAARLPTDAWIGKWVGVEGLALEISPGPDAGQYALKVTLLDGPTNFVGTANGETIRFHRDGKDAVIHKASGDETGLKYLAGKKNCLMIEKGEGFCRD